MATSLPAGQNMGSGARESGGVRPVVMSGEELVARLEAAGATLLALPARGYSTRLRTMHFDVVHTALDAYGWQAPALRPPMPGAAAISDMDEVFSWLGLIPEQKYLLRRIVGARALVHPLTGRHLFAWRKLGALLGADHKSVQRWHGQGLEILRARLAG
ncbi:DUF6362 family protein [Acidocella sp.]|uniref:DUF6362 family protein n=1 Tax=Acidocella sp. TaxID=50710 RepID=UPI00260CFF4B|nr:DUF6362 family protein [Acidocella sp.]